MNAVGLWVASLPGAYGRVNLFGTGPLLSATAGFLVIGLLKTPLRWSGSVAVVAAAIWAASTLRPDVLIAGDGRGFAVRGNDGRLAIHHTGDNFAVREWLAADAGGRDPHDQSLGQGIACDPLGCIGKLPGGGLVAYALSPEAFEGDCSRATLLFASRGDHACAAPPRQRFRHRVGGAEEFRPAVVAGPCAAPSACRHFRGIRPGRVRTWGRIASATVRRTSKRISRSSTRCPHACSFPQKRESRIGG